MNKSAELKFSTILSWDIVILLFVYLIPAISHFMSFPLYLLDPMRICVLGSLLFLRNHNNSYILAATIPLFSFFVGGHPVFIKAALISAELFANIAILLYLQKKLKNQFLVVFLSVILSKSVYYLTKQIIITRSLLDMELITTPIITQLVVAMLVSSAYVIINKNTLK